MKILAYVLALILSISFSAILTSPIIGLYGMIRAKLLNATLTFWSGLWLGGIQSVLAVLLAGWIFGWFGYSIPVLFILLVTFSIMMNNLNRINTRPNRNLEVGYLVGELLAIPVFYYSYYSSAAKGFVFL